MLDGPLLKVLIAIGVTLCGTCGDNNCHSGIRSRVSEAIGTTLAIANTMPTHAPSAPLMPLCGDKICQSAFAISYPILYSIVGNKGASVQYSVR